MLAGYESGDLVVWDWSNNTQLSSVNLNSRVGTLMTCVWDWSRDRGAVLGSEDSVVVKLGHEGVEDQLRSKVEQLEAELETCRVELRLKDEDREKSERLAEQLDNLKVKHNCNS